MYDKTDMQNTPKIILGLDPGSYHTGFGVIALENNKLKHLEHGVISAPSALQFHKRIAIIGRGVSELVARINPDVSVVERIFLGKNADSAFKLGHIRGVCLFEALKNKSEIVEYAARTIKKGVTGSGAATKEQVQMMLFAAMGLKLNSAMKIDASDALALAFYHGRMMEFTTQLKRQSLQQKRPLIKEHI